MKELFLAIPQILWDYIYLRTYFFTYNFSNPIFILVVYHLGTFLFFYYLNKLQSLSLYNPYFAQSETTFSYVNITMTNIRQNQYVLYRNEEYLFKMRVFFKPLLNKPYITTFSETYHLLGCVELYCISKLVECIGIWQVWYCSGFLFVIYQRIFIFI